MLKQSMIFGKEVIIDNGPKNSVIMPPAMTAEKNYRDVWSRPQKEIKISALKDI